MNGRTAQGLVYLTGSVLIGTTLVALAWSMAADAETAVADALRWTGRLAFLVFLIPWFASPMNQLLPGEFSRTLVRWRRLAGISFGGIQVVHVFLIVALFQIFADPGVDSATLIVGGAGIGLAIAMMVTSFDGPMGLIGSRMWKALHRAGLYVCGFIYFFDFLVAPIAFVEGSILVYVPFMLLTALAIVLRTFALFRRAQQSETVAGQTG